MELNIGYVILFVIVVLLSLYLYLNRNVENFSFIDDIVKDIEDAFIETATEMNTVKPMTQEERDKVSKLDEENRKESDRVAAEAADRTAIASGKPTAKEIVAKNEEARVKAILDNAYNNIIADYAQRGIKITSEQAEVLYFMKNYPEMRKTCKTPYGVDIKDCVKDLSLPTFDIIRACKNDGVPIIKVKEKFDDIKEGFNVIKDALKAITGVGKDLGLPGFGPDSAYETELKRIKAAKEQIVADEKAKVDADKEKEKVTKAALAADNAYKALQKKQQIRDETRAYYNKMGTNPTEYELDVLAAVAPLAKDRNVDLNVLCTWATDAEIADRARRAASAKDEAQRLIATEAEARKNVALETQRRTTVEADARRQASLGTQLRSKLGL